MDAWIPVRVDAIDRALHAIEAGCEQAQLETEVQRCLAECLGRYLDGLRVLAVAQSHAEPVHF